MPATPSDGDRRSPAPHSKADAGDSSNNPLMPMHRQFIAALLAAGALVPLAQPAEAQGTVALKAFVQQPRPAPSQPVIDPLRELERTKRVILAEQLRVEERAERRAAARRAAERERREAAERARERREAARPDVVRPTTGTLTSGFGSRWGTAHLGIDIANDLGTPIVAAADGVVVEAGPASGFGLWVQVRHDDGTITMYGHMNEITAGEGQRVSAGEQIATIGDRGYSTGPHLHFEVWQGGSTKVDPVAWLAENGVSV